MHIRKICFIASSNASKPAIILDTLFKYRLIRGYEYVLFTDSKEGQCCDICVQNHIKIINIHDAALKDEVDLMSIRTEKGDLLISMGWPHLIPEAVLKVFPAAVNCHGSILPDYRGSRSYMHYYANCEPNYGISIHYMNKDFDDGKVLIQAGYRTLESETNDDMHIRSAELCAFLLPTAIHLIEQDDEGYVPEGEKRYFFKRTPKEFMEYRKRNEQLKAEGKPLVLTPHKFIDD